MPTTSFLDRPAFVTPLSRQHLLAPGVEFPRHELKRRVLSLFWQDCCVPLQFSRAPAPVIELANDGNSPREPRPIRAWWLMEDGILMENEGPTSDRLQPYLDGAEVFLLWPRYEFQISGEPFNVLMRFHQDA